MKKLLTLLVMMVAALSVQAQDTYVVAGVESLLGVNWDGSAEANKMTTSDDGVTYVLTKTGVKLRKSTAYEFKIVKNGSEWIGDSNGNNLTYTPDADGEYTVTFTFTVASQEVQVDATKTGEATFAEQTWTVAGVPAICGTEWDPTNTDNDMTSTDGINYTLVKNDLVLEAGINYEFKVVADHSWNENYPSNNYVLKVEENGQYKVTFTFNKETKEVGAEAVKIGNAEITDKVWTIAGVKELMGSEWDKDDTNNDMTDMQDGTFQLVKKDVTLEAGKEYEFKVLSNHDWTENYGDNGNNAKMSVDADGLYDVTFVWNPESKELSVTAKTAATGIKSLKNTNVNTPMYNLQGQRVQTGFRGIVIMNGRKVIVK